MTLNLQKFRIAIATIVLVGAIVLLINFIVKRTVASSPANDSANGRMVKEIEGYTKWTKVNPEPQLMLARVARDCARPLMFGEVLVDGDNNPHRNKYFSVYINDVGREAMLNQKDPAFPEGSIIVKEKLSTKDSKAPELLTVMIKQQNGFNPASGDWEYMVVDGSGTRIDGRGNLETCQGCHVANKKGDYLFRTYLPAGIRGKLK